MEESIEEISKFVNEPNNSVKESSTSVDAEEVVAVAPDPIAVGSTREPVLKCNFCDKPFSKKSNLNRHLREIHKKHPDRLDVLPADFDSFRYKCLEGCHLSFKYNREFRMHLKDEHEFIMEEFNLFFPNSPTFSRWLQKEENESCVQYIHLTASKKRSTGSETFYFECNRTGKYNGLGADEWTRQRKQKKFGTAKLNRGCASQIIATKNPQDHYNVIYYKTHYGHDLNSAHIKLSKQKRKAIASKLLVGVPPSRIINATNKMNNQRRNVIQQKDIFNISRSFNLDINSQEIDTINITEFIDEASRQAQNPILYCKHNYTNSGDICIIIMTDAQAEIVTKFDNNLVIINVVHLLNSDFEMSTIYLFNKNGSGFPVASMFTEAKNETAYEQFYEKVAAKAGQINTKILLTNCLEFYSKAWQKVMGEVKHVLYNSSEIDLDWQVNLNKVICPDVDVNKVKRKWLHETLKIMQVIESQSEFADSLNETIRVFETDADFSEFLSYFLTNYANTCMWAFCYRQELTIDYVQNDNYMDELKRFVTNDDDCLFNKTFESLLQYIREETIRRLSKDNTKFAEIRDSIKNRHVSLKSKRFKQNDVNSECFNVIDEDLGSTYVVRQLLKYPCCHLTCTKCLICVHSFYCTCVDYFTSNSICQHIHFVWIRNFKESDSDENDEMDTDVEPKETYEHDEEIIIEIDRDNDESEDVQSTRDQIIEATKILQSNVVSINNETSLKKILMELWQVIDISQSAMSDVTKVDHNYL